MNTATDNTEVSTVQGAVQPQRLDENDLLRLLLVNRDIDLYESQMALLKMKMGEAQRAMTAFNQQLRDKYGLTERDTIDAQTGAIVRNGNPSGA